MRCGRMLRRFMYVANVLRALLTDTLQADRRYRLLTLGFLHQLAHPGDFRLAFLVSHEIALAFFVDLRNADTGFKRAGVALDVVATLFLVGERFLIQDALLRLATRKTKKIPMC